MEYTDSYYGLSHGTDQQSAQRIISDGFLVKGDKTSWCGEGVYFYDVKSKAWWAASRKCNEIDCILDYQEIVLEMVYSDFKKKYYEKSDEYEEQKNEEKE